MRLRRGLPSLRTQVLGQVVTRAFASARLRWFRVVEFSIQSDHLHLIVEADDRDALSRGAAGLAIRIARRINLALGARRRVFGGRYHARALKSPREVRRALVYVLLNARKHGRLVHGIDPMSSGIAFDGWRDVGSRGPPPPGIRSTLGIHEAATWLLARGWRQHGLIALDEHPAMD